MKCEACEKLIAKHLLGEASEAEESRLNLHTGNCASCRDLMGSLASLCEDYRSRAQVAESVDEGAIMKRIGGVESSPNTSFRPRRWGFALAATVAVVFIGFSLARYLTGERLPQEMPVIIADSRGELRSPAETDVVGAPLVSSVALAKEDAAPIKPDVAEEQQVVADSHDVGAGFPALRSFSGVGKPAQGDDEIQPSPADPHIDTSPLQFSARSMPAAAGRASSGGSVAAPAIIPEYTQQPTIEPTVEATPSPRCSPVTEAVAVPLQVFHNVINVNNNERMRIVVNAQGLVRVSVYDKEGNVTVKLLEENISGEKELYWDGQSGGGRSVAAGVYLLVMETEDCRDKKKIIIIK